MAPPSFVGSTTLASSELDLGQFVAPSIFPSKQGIGLGIGLTSLVENGLGFRIPEDLSSELV
jgi:hypothetical protein